MPPVERRRILKVNQRGNNNSNHVLCTVGTKKGNYLVNCSTGRGSDRQCFLIFFIAVLLLETELKTEKTLTIYLNNAKRRKCCNTVVTFFWFKKVTTK